VLDSKRSLIDKIWQGEQALALDNFRVGEGILAHLSEQQLEQLAIDILIKLVFLSTLNQKLEIMVKEDDTIGMATSSKLYVGNLNFDTTAEAIVHLFETIGAVKSVKILSKDGKSLGYGFIEMADVDSAQRAQLQLNRHILDGRQIRVEFPKDNKIKQNQNFTKSF
ncbi:MAG: hypothetical protein EZS28_006940, partial [Streblomastix strix]